MIGLRKPGRAAPEPTARKIPASPGPDGESREGYRRPSVTELAAAGRALQAGAFRSLDPTAPSTSPPAADSPPKVRGRRRGRRPGPVGDVHPATLTEAVVDVDAVTVTIDADFDVPPAGGKLTSGRGRTWAVRTAALFGPMLLLGGVLLLVGVQLGSARVPAEAAISDAEADRFGLSTFPVDRAAAFGAAYLQLCLTHPSVEDELAGERRLAALSGMVSAGVAAGCGWDGESGGPQTVAAVTYAGQLTATPADTFTAGVAAYLTYTATLGDGTQLGVTVAVWVADDNAGLRVVGDVGFVPVPPRGSPPAPELPGTSDSDLAGQVQTQVVEPFLVAWAASDLVQLDLAVTVDASAAARSGLAGLLTAPEVTDLDVFAGQPLEDRDVTYVDGDVVRVHAAVRWATPTGGVQTAGYQLTLRRVAGKWLVADIAGAVLDPAGGAAADRAIPLPIPTPAAPVVSTGSATP